jgi:putative ATP-dependent endonuclease of the OLD family
MSELKAEEICSKSPGEPGVVELWVHIPKGAENIDEKWKEEAEGMLLVRSKWEWPPQGGKPTRSTWDPQTDEYAEDGKAAGLDQVFNSRLPKPFRIGSLEDPTDEHKKLLELVLDPIKTRLAQLMNDETSELFSKIKLLKDEAEKPVAEFRKSLDEVQKGVNSSYKRVFSESEIRLNISLSELVLDPTGALLKSSRIEVVESHGPVRWHQQGTGSQRALFWSMLEVRSELNRLYEQKKAREKLAKDKEKELKKKRTELDKLKTAASIEKKLGRQS